MAKQEWEIMADQIRDAYISVYGAERWAALTDQQKHDAVMIIARDMLNRLERN